MVEKTTGLILRKRRLTESSLIIHWLTPNLGRLATVAKGALRPKSTFRGRLDLFYEADFSFNRSRRSELHTLTEVKTREIHSPLRVDLTYLQQACYCAELVEQTTETDTPLPEIFELMRSLLEHLPRQGPMLQTVFAFEMKLLDSLGLQPDPVESALSAGARCLLEVLGKGDWETIARLRISVPQAKELSRFLEGFMVYHLGRVPRERMTALQCPA
jgi:DNA repair protein RecO (recombination protein O)